MCIFGRDIFLILCGWDYCTLFQLKVEKNFKSQSAICPTFLSLFREVFFSIYCVHFFPFLCVFFLWNVTTYTAIFLSSSGHRLHHQLLFLLLGVDDQQAAASAEADRAAKTEAADFQSSPESIPATSPTDLGLFGKISSSTTVFQLESLRSVAGSSRNLGRSP